MFIYLKKFSGEKGEISATTNQAMHSSLINLLIICPSELNHGCNSKSTSCFSFYSCLRKFLTTAVTLSTAPFKSFISLWLKILDTIFNPCLELQCPAASPG